MADALYNTAFTVPGVKLRKVTKADAILPDGMARGLLVGSAGTANLMDASSEILADVPLQQGFNPLFVKQVRLGGTADDIWAIY